MLVVVLFIIAIFFRILPAEDSKLVISLKSKRDRADDPLKMISFCVGCPAPENEGSAVFGLIAKHGARSYDAKGEVVYAVPNHAEDELLNKHHFHQRFVFVERGKIGLLEKINRIQDSAAIGIIIADDGRCKEDFSSCGSRAGSVKEGGFASGDDPDNWKHIRIPILMITTSTADRLRKLMNIVEIDIPGLGIQKMIEFPDDEDHDEF